MLTGPSPPDFPTWLNAIEDRRELYPALRSFEFGIAGVSTDVMKRLIYAYLTSQMVTIWIRSDEKRKEGYVDAAAFMPICDEAAWPDLDTLTVEFKGSTKETLRIHSAICSIITSRTSIHHLRLHFCVGHHPRSFDENSSIAWLRARVDLEYLNICVLCVLHGTARIILGCILAATAKKCLCSPLAHHTFDIWTAV
jgi:hypothetical protein